MISDKVIKSCYDNLDKFIDIYPEDYKRNIMPDNLKLTVYCKGSNYEGFLVNVTSDELGFDALIAQKWIIHSDLEKIVGCPLV